MNRPNSPGSVGIKRAGPIRLLTLTTLFPNSHRLRHGIFVANRLRRLCDTGRVEATVIAAVPWFPGAYRDFSGVPEAETVFGFRVRHPRYIQVPAIGMRVQPGSLARALLEAVRRNRMDRSSFDVVDAHYFYPDGVAAARVAQELDLPLVISARGSDINLIGEIPFALQRMLHAAKRAEALIAVSAALAARMTALGMPADRTHVLRNGVDTDLFCPFPRPESRERLGMREGSAWVLGVGNLVPEKGFELLIRAMAALPHARLLIVGQGPLRNALRSLAAAIAPGRVEFRDNMSQSDLRFAYAACNVLGLPSLREGWPNVVLEAISCGTPVVAAAVGGVPEILQTGAPALLVHEQSPHNWECALRTLLEASPAPEKVRQYALQFGWEEIVTRQCALYEAVVAARASTMHRRYA
jgi:teichuronic acid biosynthesis glycosyltransferase TuaC